MSARATRRAAAAVLIAGVSAARPAYAHRLDEYLQATTLAVARNRVRVQMRLTPGVAVFGRVFATIDTDGDGAVSAAEQRSYAAQVLRDLSFAVDGTPRSLRLVAVSFPDVVALREGRGEIVLDAEAAVPNGNPARRLTFDNRHQRAIAVYLVNALVPVDSAVRITGQRRTPDQSSYVLDYARTGERSGLQALVPASSAWPWIGAAVLLPLGWLMLLRQRRAEAAGAADRA